MRNTMLEKIPWNNVQYLIELDQKQKGEKFSKAAVQLYLKKQMIGYPNKFSAEMLDKDAAIFREAPSLKKEAAKEKKPNLIKRIT